MTLRELAKRARKIDVEELALNVAKGNSGLILKRQREQLTVGENAAGRDVGKYKSDKYARFKKRIGSQAPSGIVDLKLSGDLYAKLNVEIDRKKFEINSNVEYSKYQIKRYGKEIYGLQSENAEDVKFKNSKDIGAAYKKALGL